MAVYGAHKVERVQEGMPKKRAIVCTLMDERKHNIILDSSRVYLKGSPFYVSEDRTPKQKEAKRKQYAKRLARQGKTPPLRRTLNRGPRPMGHTSLYK